MQEHDRAVADLREILVRGLSFALRSRGHTRGRSHEALIEDFCHDALLRILDSIDGFEGRSRFTTWAMKIAVNVALTELRRKRWRNVSLDQIVEAAGEGAGPVASEEGPHVAAERSDVMAWLQRIMKEELTDRQRTAISAVAFGGMSLTEVATRMNTNRNALYKVMHDGRLRLKRRLEREGTSESEIIDDLERKR